MEKKGKIILWSSVAIFIILLAFLSIPIFFKKSWWWFFIPLILSSIGGIVFLVIFLIRKAGLKRKEEEVEPKDKKIEQEDASKVINKILTYEFADYFKKSEEKITHEGIAGKPKTPVFHKWGKGYYEDIKYYFLMNLNDPKQVTKLKQETKESDKVFKKRVDEALLKFAPDPEIFEPEIKEHITPEGTIIRTTKKKQTKAEVEKEEKEAETEEKEEI